MKLWTVVFKKAPSQAKTPEVYVGWIMFLTLWKKKKTNLPCSNVQKRDLPLNEKRAEKTIEIEFVENCYIGII